MKKTIIIITLLIAGGFLSLEHNKSINNEIGLSLGDWFQTSNQTIIMNNETTINNFTVFFEKVFELPNSNFSYYWGYEKNTGFVIAAKAQFNNESATFNFKNIPSFTKGNETIYLHQKSFLNISGYWIGEVTTPYYLVNKGVTEYLINNSLEYGYKYELWVDGRYSQGWLNYTNPEENEFMNATMFGNGTIMINDNGTIVYITGDLIHNYDLIYAPGLFSVVDFRFYYNDTQVTNSSKLDLFKRFMSPRVNELLRPDYVYHVDKAFVRNYYKWEPTEVIHSQITFSNGMQIPGETSTNNNTLKLPTTWIPMLALVIPLTRKKRK